MWLVVHEKGAEEGVESKIEMERVLLSFYVLVILFSKQTTY
jgi:hypothetical protein